MRSACFCLCALLLLFCAAAHAEEEGVFTLGPGDVLHIVVYDEPDLERLVTVQPDGMIRFPLVRQVKVGGLSVHNAEIEIERLLGEKFLADPNVTITVKEFNSKKVYVLGAVRIPGLYTLNGPTTVLEVVSKAGGILETGSRQILLVHGATAKSSDLSKILRDKAREAAAAATAADLKENAAATAAASAPAGGPSPAKPDVNAGAPPAPAGDSAPTKPQAGDVEPRGEAGAKPADKPAESTAPLVIDGHKLFDLGDVSQNRYLQDGDVVYVPQAHMVYVLGEVKKPGAVPYSDGLTMVQAVSLAGDVTDMASSTVYITRSVNGKEQRIKADFSDALKDRTKDIELQPDDVINVKRRIL